jgi:hypothetical protein
MEYGHPEKRRKSKHKKKERKKHPYRKGGKYRTTKLKKEKK